MILIPGTHVVPLNGVKLSYTVFGNGPPLFAVSSGWGVGSGYLQKALEPLADQFTLICVTTRGSGGSSRPVDATAMSSATMADDIDHLRRYLGFETIDLFGHSNGAAIAIFYAAKYPWACRKLILADGQLMGFAANEATAAILAERASDPRFADALASLQAIGSLTFEDEAITDFLIATFPLYFHDPDANMHKTIETFDLPIESWATEKQRLADMQLSADQREILPQIHADTLVIVGRDDFQCPVPTSERMARGIDESRLVVLENCGHMPWAEQPEIFFQEIREFLAGARCSDGLSSCKSTSARSC
jgi:proline iminopeptidase